MLRNSFKNSQLLLQTECSLKNQRSLHVSNSICAKHMNINRQSKIMGKLFGDRVAGSKKRWYPSAEKNSQTPIFSPSQFGSKKSAGGGKNTIRRMTVLNKLFMTHITDLLATGEASEGILGRGLQVTRVKISPDFTAINVYWLGSGQPLTDAQLEVELQRCSGLLRHELSQLALMGEVPRISFVRDKTNANLTVVESLLRNIDLRDIDEQNVEERQRNDPFREAKEEFFGKILNAPPIERVNVEAAEVERDVEQQLPEMRHDVFGLDHRDIMSKILTKMRKTQKAWEQHSKGASKSEEMPGATQLERINQKLAAAAETANKFDEFLARWREQKNTPERKRHRRSPEEWTDAEMGAGLDAATEAVLSKEQRRLHDEEDYLLEDHESGRKI